MLLGINVPLFLKSSVSESLESYGLCVWQGSVHPGDKPERAASLLTSHLSHISSISRSCHCCLLTTPVSLLLSSVVQPARVLWTHINNLLTGLPGSFLIAALCPLLLPTTAIKENKNKYNVPLHSHSICGIPFTARKIIILARAAVRKHHRLRGFKD